MRLLVLSPAVPGSFELEMLQRVFDEKRIEDDKLTHIRSRAPDAPHVAVRRLSALFAMGAD